MLPTVVTVTEFVVTEKFADVAAAGTVTELGTLAATLAFDKLIMTLAGGAAVVRVTVPDPDCPPITADGLTPQSTTPVHSTRIITELDHFKIVCRQTAKAGFKMSLFQRVS